MGNQTFDAIVIGSGISGGWAAKELCEKGLKVLMLERGGPYEHVKDYKSAQKNPWEFEHRGGTTAEQRKKYPVIHRGWAASEGVMDGWANETDCPYTETKPFTWWRSYRMGGRSILWGRQSYRLSPMDFQANEREGVAVPWPIGYEDVAPWYDYVEKFAGISGSVEDIAHLPDGHFLPPMELNCVEKDVAKRLKAHYKDNRHLIIGRTANLTAEIPGRTKCQFRNRCWEGCPFGGYFSTQSSTLPAAMNTGNLTVRPYSLVTQILYDKDTKKARGVELLDTENNQTYEFNSKIVFLCASALNSAWVLFNSATDIWPGGLGSSSNELGHNIMDHHYNIGAQGTVEGFEDQYVFGKRANGFYIPRFANLSGDKRDYLRGFGYQGSASREGWSREVAELNIGGNFKDALTEPGKWTIGATAFGEILPYHENKITLDPNKKDKWGLPVLNMDAELKENELKMRKDMRKEMEAMFDVVGIKNITSWDGGHAMGHGIHEMGTARMGRDPKTSVLNKWNQVWDCKNVFVTDGSCMTSSACQNPSLTYMALTARAVDYAVNELKKNNL
ncbi:GMC family oxidoreductase [Pedobacter antarcticus 4BY]|uniref:GMC family oxidoreductase n=2 Tax=Pedobacter antarcticus TaxID=34086 RepID=A0A081PHW9_9SPHI|nr:GMC family oxidoreductase [Pedobacter antarcticus]KEQ30292.1 GMC family oxidoreductase [Pedobacter antarcticus 4BY]SFE32058.1 Choline dehydrogenase [Pedobacter antarcticus]